MTFWKDHSRRDTATQTASQPPPPHKALRSFLYFRSAHFSGELSAAPIPDRVGMHLSLGVGNVIFVVVLEFKQHRMPFPCSQVADSWLATWGWRHLNDKSVALLYDIFHVSGQGTSDSHFFELKPYSILRQVRKQHHSEVNFGNRIPRNAVSIAAKKYILYPSEFDSSRERLWSRLEKKEYPATTFPYRISEAAHSKITPPTSDLAGI